MHPLMASAAAAAPAASKRRWRFGMLAALAVATLIAGCSSLDEQQRRWIFQPSNRSWISASPAADAMQEVWIDFASREAAAPVRLHGLWLASARSDAPVLLYLHGARWDVRSSAYRMRRMVDLGFSVLGIDYRGFGQSTQELPSEASALEDARAAWDWLAKQHPNAKRYIFGHSLGGAIGVQLAAELDSGTPVSTLSGLIVEGAFTSIADVLRTFKWGWLPVEPLITQRFDAAQQITRVKVPLLVVHGSEDQLIKPALGRALFERAPGPKRFVLVEGGTHHNTNAIAQPVYRKAMSELFGLPLVPQ